MARFLFVWELGGGSGHWANIEPIARELIRRGHQVTASLRYVTVASSALQDSDIKILPACYSSALQPEKKEPARSFAQLLHNVGWSEEDRLSSLIASWRDIFEIVSPDVVVAEHSPTALLAARGLGLPLVTLGTGFFSPPDLTPFPDFMPWLPPDPDYASEESIILNRANRVLRQAEMPELDHLSSLYVEVADNILLTFRELDHYPQRSHGEYFGMWPLAKGAQPEWPDTPFNQKLFAYLKPFPTLPEFLELLNKVNAASLIYAPEVDRQLKERCASNRLVFQDTRPDIKEVAALVDLGITNGNAGTVTSLLLEGIPVFMIPLFTEQAVFSKQVYDLGAGTLCGCNPFEELQRVFISTLDRYPELKASAQSFSARYSNFSPSEAVQRATSRIEKLATSGGF